MEQEKREFEHRLSVGGVEGLADDERILYETKKQIAEDNAETEFMINKLLNEDMLEINFKQFENFKRDDTFMNEWAK